VPIWIDEIVDIEQWKTDFLKPEAREVIEAVGAWIYCFSNSPVTASEHVGENVESVMKAIGDIIEQACGYSWDGTRLALDMSSQQPSQIEALEEQCMEHSFEYIHADAKGRNEFGEPVGLARVREALETNDWNDQTNDDSDHEDMLGDFDMEKAQMNSELWGLKASLLDADGDGDNDQDDEEFKVENMEQMMSQLLAIRGECLGAPNLLHLAVQSSYQLETTAGMPEPDRKVFASRAVNNLMTDL